MHSEIILTSNTLNCNDVGSSAPEFILTLKIFAIKDGRKF